MRKSLLTDEQIVGFLKQAEAGLRPARRLEAVKAETFVGADAARASA
jgi:hypothetical protein